MPNWIAPFRADDVVWKKGNLHVSNATNAFQSEYFKKLSGIGTCKLWQVGDTFFPDISLKINR